jgi:hypothetical protein
VSGAVGEDEEPGMNGKRGGKKKKSLDALERLGLSCIPQLSDNPQQEITS